MIAADLSKTLAAVLSVIVLIIVSRRSLNILGKAIEGVISSETILRIIGLKAVVAAISFLPPALFLSILMVIGRMHRDNEVAALAAGGIGLARLYRAIFVFTGPMFLAAAFLSLYVMPWCEAKVEQIYQTDERGADFRGISAGRFSEYSQGDLVVYVESIDEDKIMHNIFVQNRKPGQLAIISAQRGRIKDLADGRYVILEQGTQVEGNPGARDFILMEFKEYAIRIEERDASLIVYDREAVPSEILWRSENLKDIAELQRRISIPLGLLILASLAVPLAQVAPRGGIYGNLVSAFLIYLVYGNLLRIIHGWVVKGVAPVWFGYSGLYVLMALVTAFLLVRTLGREWVMQVVTGRVAS